MVVVAWMCLVCAPILAPLVFFAVWQQRWIGWLLAFLAAVLLATLGLAASGVGFVEPVADVGWVLLCYAVYCFLAASCFRIRATGLRALVLLLAAVPICIGYVLATVGFLGLFAIVGEASREPSHVERMPGGLTCQVTLWGWGMAFSAGGYSVDLYRSWTWLPLVRRRVAGVRVNQFANDREASCSDVLASYHDRFP